MTHAFTHHLLPALRAFGSTTAPDVTTIQRAAYWELRHPNVFQVTLFLETWRTTDLQRYLDAGWVRVNDDESLAGYTATPDLDTGVSSGVHGN